LGRAQSRTEKEKTHAAIYMKSNTILNKHQSAILDRISNDDFLSGTFYFSGGTALSDMYLHHRESVDLDFFTPQLYDSQSIVSRLTSWSQDLQFTLAGEYVEPTHMYFLTFADDSKLKVDFAHYPYKQLESMKPYRNKLKVDSLRDIAANKLLTLTQRTEVKDFVDIYFLLQKFTFWNLRDDVQTKFHMEIDPFIFAGDCMEVQEFDFLPKMIQPLDLLQIQNFYKQLAVKLGKKSIE